ncbi:hypothetical protein GCM10023405_50620 [Streptomonospora salina]
MQGAPYLAGAAVEDARGGGQGDAGVPGDLIQCHVSAAHGFTFRPDCGKTFSAVRSYACAQPPLPAASAARRGAPRHAEESAPGGRGGRADRALAPAGNRFQWFVAPDPLRAPA